MQIKLNAYWKLSYLKLLKYLLYVNESKVKRLCIENFRNKTEKLQCTMYIIFVKANDNLSISNACDLFGFNTGCTHTNTHPSTLIKIRLEIIYNLKLE